MVVSPLLMKALGKSLTSPTYLTDGLLYACIQLRRLYMILVLPPLLPDSDLVLISHWRRKLKNYLHPFCGNLHWQDVVLCHLGGDFFGQ